MATVATAIAIWSIGMLVVVVVFLGVEKLS